MTQTHDLPQETLDWFGGDDLRARCFADKYSLFVDGERVETLPDQMWARVADEIASVERKPAEWQKRFYSLLEDFRFIPGGRILYAAGNPKNATLTNCYYTDIAEDSIEGIFDWCKSAARTYSFGGGNGVCIGKLRPKGAEVNNAARFSSGAVSFMELFSQTTGIIGTHNRRGALMITIPVDHPDVEDFVDIKHGNTDQVRNANISIKLTDEFMRAVRNKDMFTLRFSFDAPNKADIEREVDAAELWDKIIQSAWASAEPGLVFWDRIKEESPSEYCSPVKGTNPCQPGWATVLTPDGIRHLDHVDVGDTVWTGKRWAQISNKVFTGVKDVYAYHTRGGIFYGTPDHRVLSKGGKIEVGEAEEIDTVTGPVEDPPVMEPQAMMDGLVVGDGSTHKASNGLIYLNIGEHDQCYFEDESVAQKLQKPRPGIGDYAHEVETTIDSLPRTYERTIPYKYFVASRDEKCSFLRGLYSANGSIVAQRVTLKASSFSIIEQVQQMLSSLGIRSYYTTNKPTTIQFDNGEYTTRMSYDLNISTDRNKFRDLIGFIHPYKQQKLDAICDKVGSSEYASNTRRGKKTYEIVEVEYISTEPVYDITVDADEHTYWTGGLLVSNCGEQPLGNNGACTLGHVNLSKMVSDEFTYNAQVDWDLLSSTVQDAVRFLDNVVEYNLPRHAHAEQAEKARNTRRIGLGVTGLGDMLIKLGIKYDSNEAVAFIDNLMEFIRDSAYSASADIAKEKGSFPLFDVDEHLRRPFVSRLPGGLQSKIRDYGLRNVAILTVAPVGSGSVLAGCTSGIEPIFALRYNRRSEGLSQEWYQVEHQLVREYREATGNGGALPETFVTAHDIDPFFRVKLQGTVQKYIDSAISSTINLPRDIDVETVKRIYQYGWEMGCKGITVYREGSREGILLTENAEQPAQQTTESRERPAVTHGRTYRLATEMGNLYVTVNSDDEGLIEMFPNLGKSGSASHAFTEALGRLTSLCLRKGIAPADVIEELDGIKGTRPMVQEDGSVVQSVPDAIAKALEKALTSDGFELPDVIVTALCPECGGVMFNENGCATCQECGHSKCG